LAENPKAAITFFWMEMERQIRIEGSVKKTSRKESEDYFHSRPYQSKLSAIVSPQSKTVQGRRQLEEAKQKLREECSEQALQCPDNWGGFLLIPEYFEFWQGRESRLHDRITYKPTSTGWEIRRIAP
jgi:pyridoxamine 5'-phosphate oxidase